MNEAVKRAPRADGQRNKAKLVQAAHSIVNAGCVELYLEHVARDAGVSIATLYRHFPTREALLLEISQQDSLDYRDRAAQLLNEKKPVEALGQWLQEMSWYGLTRPGMGSAFRAASNNPIGDEVYRTFRDALESLLKAGRHAGSVRTDLSAGDVLLALCGIWELKDSAESRAQCLRLSGLILDGLTAPTMTGVRE